MAKKWFVRLVFLGLLGLLVWAWRHSDSRQSDSTPSSARVDQTAKNPTPPAESSSSKAHVANTGPAGQNVPINPTEDEQDLPKLLIRLRANAAAGDAVSECKFSEVLRVCAKNQRRWLQQRRDVAVLSTPPEKLLPITDEDYARKLEQHRKTYATLITEQAKLRESWEACSSQAPDSLGEYVDLLVQRTQRNDPRAIAELIDLPDATLTQLALKRPEWIALHAKLITTHIQNPGNWIAFSGSSVFERISDALYENAGTSAWWNTRFPPNPELSYLYLLLTTANQEQLIGILRASGAGDWAQGLDQSQIEKVALMLELESKLQADAIRQMQTKAKVLLQTVQALRLKASQQMRNLLQAPKAGDGEAWMHWNLSKCEIQYD